MGVNSHTVFYRIFFNFLFNMTNKSASKTHGHTKSKILRPKSSLRVRYNKSKAAERKQELRDIIQAA